MKAHAYVLGQERKSRMGGISRGRPGGCLGGRPGPKTFTPSIGAQENQVF